MKPKKHKTDRLYVYSFDQINSFTLRHLASLPHTRTYWE